MDKQTLKNNLRACRARAGKTQGDVAEALGIGRKAYYEVEKNPTRCTVERLHDIAEYLGCSVSDFFMGVDTTEREVN